MKKILKSRIFIFVITAIIFSGIGVYAESRYRAEEITYKTDTTETVNDALNALYKKNNLKKLTLI